MKVGERYDVADAQSGIIYNTILIIDVWKESNAYLILDHQGCWWSYLNDRLSVYVRVN